MNQALLQKIKIAQRHAGISGWLEDWDIEHIYDEVEKLHSGQIYLEIGVAHGQSMSVAALAAKPGVQLYGIDVIDWKDRNSSITKVVGEIDKEKDVDIQFIEGDSQLWARYWRNGEVDVLFFDGDHTYQGVVKDIASWVPWVNSGGIMLFDDYNEKTGVREAINNILHEHAQFTDFTIDGEMYICRKL